MVNDEPIVLLDRLILYNWQQSNWPGDFVAKAGLTDLLLAFVDHAGRVGGLLEGLPDELGSEAMLDLMISEAICISKASIHLGMEGFLTFDDRQRALAESEGLAVPL